MKYILKTLQISALFLVGNFSIFSMNNKLPSPYIFPAEIKEEDTIVDAAVNDYQFIIHNPQNYKDNVILASRYSSLLGLGICSGNMLYKPFVKNIGVRKRWYGAAVGLSAAYYFTNKYRNFVWSHTKK